MQTTTCCRSKINLGGTKVGPVPSLDAICGEIGKPNVDATVTQFHRKAGFRPPLVAVLGVNVTMVAVWALIYNYAGGPVWLW